jgi:hypothetical protein
VSEPFAPPAAGAVGGRSDGPRFVGAVWGLLLLNTLGFTAVDLIIPLPRAVFQAVAMGALLAAFGLALLANPRVRLRPSVYLLLLSMLAVVAIASSIRLQSGYGSVFRCFRLSLFVATLWLISRWWQGDLRFARYHLRALGVVLLSVLAGLVISPGSAFSGVDGRLAGAIWPIPAPQVGQYCAVAIGLALVLWITKNIDGRSAAVVAVPSVVLLLLSHTRTALIGLVVALTVAGLTLAFSHTRARRFLAVCIVLGAFVAVALGQVVLAFLARGQDAEMLTSLTGRQTKWDLVLARERTFDEQLLGLGLGDKSINGLAIDNSWLSTYHELGWLGLGITVAVVICLLGSVALRPPSAARACAVFLIVYCLIASYTEVGLGDASPYLLHLAVAASALAGRSAARADLATAVRGAAAG